MIRSWLKAQNRKYDLVKEPKRAFILLGLVLPGIIMSITDNIPIFLVVMGYLLMLLAIRMLYIQDKL